MPNLYNIIMYQEDDGSYVLFENYVIKKTQDIYWVYRRRDDRQFEFGSLKNATSWVILDNATKISEANRVLDLDNKLTSLKTELRVHRKIKVNPEIQRDKFLFNLYKQNKFQWELDKYIIMAKLCQERGFQNELTRTS